MKHKARGGGRNFREVCLAESKFDCEKFAFVSKEILASPKVVLKPLTAKWLPMALRTVLYSGLLDWPERIALCI